MTSHRLDHAGTATSLACAVHCAVSPLLLPLLPFAAAKFAGPAMEWAFVGTTLLLGIASLGHSFRVVHRDARALMLFMAGFTCLATARLVPATESYEGWLVGVAATLIVSSHLLNLKLRRAAAATGCGCPCHEPNI